MGAHGGVPLLSRLTCRGRPPCLPCQTEAHLRHKYEKLSCSKRSVGRERTGVRAEILRFAQNDEWDGRYTS